MYQDGQGNRRVEEEKRKAKEEMDGQGEGAGGVHD